MFCLAGADNLPLPLYQREVLLYTGKVLAVHSPVQVPHCTATLRVQSGTPHSANLKVPPSASTGVSAEPQVRARGPLEPRRACASAGKVVAGA